MTDLFREFFQTVGDRLRNRVFGPYLIALLFWNWKPILMILGSNRSIEYTIQEIENGNMFNVWNVLLIPIGISIVYSIASPYLNNALDIVTSKSVQKRIKSKFELKGKQLDEEISIASKIFQLEDAKAGNLKLADLTSKIEALQKSNEQYMNENVDLRKEISALDYRSSDVGQWELEKAKKASDRAVEKLKENFYEIVDLLLHLVNSALQKGDFQLSTIPDSIVKNLMEHGFIESQHINSRSYYKFTQAGRDRHFSLESIKDDEQQDPRV